MSELAMFLEAAAAFGDEALPPAYTPAAARTTPPRTPSSAASAALAAAAPTLRAAEPWGVPAAQVAACAPSGGACAAVGAAPQLALDNECLSWESFGGAERPARLGAAAEARGAAAAQPASGSMAHSVREQMAELEHGLHAIMACKELYSASPAYAASAEPACAAAEGHYKRSACSAGALPMPASPQGGSASAAPCAALPAARPSPCQTPGLSSPLTSAEGAPTTPSAPQLPMHLSSSPLQGQATAGPPQRALPGAAALRQSVQAEDAATPLAAGLRFGAWVDALGPLYKEQAQSSWGQEEALRGCSGQPAGLDVGSAALAGGGGGWGDASGTWAGSAARSEEGAARHAEHSCSSCARGSVAASAARPEAGGANGSERGDIGACNAQECGGSVCPPWKRSPVDSEAVTARPYGSGELPWQPAPAATGTAAAPAPGNPFAGLPASPARPSPETLAHGNPFRRASAPHAVCCSGSS